MLDVSLAEDIDFEPEIIDQDCYRGLRGGNWCVFSKSRDKNTLLFIDGAVDKTSMLRLKGENIIHIVLDWIDQNNPDVCSLIEYLIAQGYIATSTMYNAEELKVSHLESVEG